MVRAVLVDVDGTLCADGRVFDGVPTALDEMRNQGLLLCFLTNIDSMPPAHIAAELSSLGLGISADEVFSPVTAAALLLRRESNPRVFALVSASLRPFVPHLVDEPPYTHVLIGDCREVLDYPQLDSAFRALRKGAHLLALQRGRYFKRADGDHIDTGAIVSGLEYSSGMAARVLGKPSADFLTLAAATLGVTLADCLVVGDDASTDIAGGRAAGARTAQVRTGKFADQVTEGLTLDADLLLDSICDLPAALRTMVP